MKGIRNFFSFPLSEGRDPRKTQVNGWTGGLKDQGHIIHGEPARGHGRSTDTYKIPTTASDGLHPPPAWPSVVPWRIACRRHYGATPRNGCSPRRLAEQGNRSSARASSFPKRRRHVLYRPHGSLGSGPSRAHRPIFTAGIFMPSTKNR